MNKVLLMGRLCFTPELKVTESGIEVLSTRIAVSRNYIKKGEEKKSDFINIVAWRKTAVFISEYFKKGDGIIIEGSIQTRSYTTNDGSNRDVVEVLVDRADFPLTRRSGNNEVTTANTVPSSPSTSSTASLDVIVDDEKTTDKKPTDENLIDENQIDDLPF